MPKLQQLPKEIVEGNDLIHHFVNGGWKVARMTAGGDWAYLNDPYSTAAAAQLVCDKQNKWQKPDEQYSVMANVVDFTLRYHESWDALIPVLEKIESLRYRTCIDGGTDQFGNYCHIKKWRTDLELNAFVAVGDSDKVISERPTKIETVYFAVVEFIKWYNTKTLS